MTQTTHLQNSTYNEFGTFPSAEGHPYTSVNRSVQVIVESYGSKPSTDVEVEAVFEIAFGGSLVSIPFRAMSVDGEVFESKAAALADLKFLKEAFDEWHSEARRAFDEFPG